MLKRIVVSECPEILNQSRFNNRGGINIPKASFLKQRKGINISTETHSWITGR